jgi:hypothetical protein
MTLKELIAIEDKASEVWVVSPGLHYDVDNKDFSELVSVNLGEKTKYKYIVPETKAINKHIKAYRKMYSLTKKEIKKNFLILPDTAFNPFIMETAIYNANTECIACAAPAMEGTNDVIKMDNETAQRLAKHFRKLWKKYKRCNP